MRQLPIKHVKIRRANFTTTPGLWAKFFTISLFVHEYSFREFVRAIFVWPWNKKARTKKKQQTNGNRAIWLVYGTDTNARGFWLVKRTLGWKIFMPENFLEINRYLALTSYCNTIGQSNNTFSILGLSLAGKLKGHIWSFRPLADKTNNEHLPKPFFNVIRRSL